MKEMEIEEEEGSVIIIDGSLLRMRGKIGNE
jgi:hypothetical protein